MKGPQVQACIIVVSLLLSAAVCQRASAITRRQTTAQKSETQSVDLAEATSLSAQVVKLYGERKYGEAIPLAERVVALRAKALGENHALVGDAWLNLAELHWARRKHKEADAAFQKSFAIWDAAPEANEARLITALNRYVCLLNETERHSDSLAAERRLYKLENKFEFEPDGSDRTEKNLKLAGLLMSRRETTPAPKYPQAALNQRLEGAVVMKITVDEVGRVAEVKILCGHPVLAESAGQAIAKARFKPALVAGRPVKVIGVAVYRFNIQ